MLSWLEQGKLELFQEETRAEILRTYQLLSGTRKSPVLRAGEVMNRSVVTIEQSTKTEDALKIMRERSVHHLPVLREGRLVGLVSDRDLLQHKERMTLPVQNIMTKRLLTARPDSHLWSVAQIMTQKKVNCVLVLDPEQNLQGILTSLDLLACMTHQAPVEVWL